MESFPQLCEPQNSTTKIVNSEFWHEYLTLLGYTEYTTKMDRASPNLQCCLQVNQWSAMWQKVQPAVPTGPARTQLPSRVLPGLWLASHSPLNPWHTTGGFRLMRSLLCHQILLMMSLQVSVMNGWVQWPLEANPARFSVSFVMYFFCAAFVGWAVSASVTPCLWSRPTVLLIQTTLLFFLCSFSLRPSF